MSKRPPPWQLPTIIAGSLAALAALGTGVITLSRYLTLPERVEASEQKNVQQDEAINKLTAINDTWQKIYQQQQQQQAANRPKRCEQQDADHQWWCRDAGCQGEDNWYRCNE